MDEKNQAYTRLLEPFNIGPVYLKNRMVMSPLYTIFASVEGEVTQQLIDHYVARAKGGTSLIIIEGTAVDGRHVWEEAELRIDATKYMAGLHRLVDSVHMEGVPIFVQLHHAGMFGSDPVSPSGVVSYEVGRIGSVQARVMSLEEAEEVRDLHIAAAVRAKNIGFDGVEIHGGTSYLLQQWVSPHTNHRLDRYGGSFENRIQLPMEIVRGIRKECGVDYPIGYSLVADELLPDGITVEEAKGFAKRLEQEGVNYITLMVGTYETFTLEEGLGLNYRQARGLFEFSADFKKEVNMLVFARAYGAGEPYMWEEALKQGQADAVTLGRPLLCDPELPNKVVDRRIDDIRLCLRCAYCLESAIVRHRQVSCAINPEVGKDREYAIQRTSNQKKVLIVGGGPGGLEAARVAALRGHDVSLIEKEAELGGNLKIAALPIGKSEFKTYFIDWLERQCKKCGVKIEVNKKVTAGLVKAYKPDAVIIATGASPHLPDIPGITKPLVVDAADVLTGKAQVGRKVVVAGGGQIGVEVADFIAEKGLAESVTIVEMLPMIAMDMDPMNMSYYMMNIIPKYGLRPLTNLKIEEITDSGLIAIDKEWKQHKIEADTVVIAMGYTPNRAIYNTLKDEVAELYMVGDCVKPRKLVNAIHEGAYFARKI